MNTAYALPFSDLTFTEGSADVLWLRDIADDPDDLYTDALVASGDYFETLAVTLEQVACALPSACVEQYQLQDTIGRLLYLQHHYDITKKRP